MDRAQKRETEITVLGTIITYGCMISGAVCGIICAYDVLSRRWLESPAMADKQTAPKAHVTVALTTGILSACFFTIALLGLWFSTVTPGFNPPWPDAIICDVTKTINSDPLPVEFYYRGINKWRSLRAPVAEYYAIWDYNDTIQDYPRRPPTPRESSSHEIWFLTEWPGRLFRAEEITADEAATDIRMKHYKDNWILDVNCVGPKRSPQSRGYQSMKDIEKNGRAFTFAHKMSRSNFIEAGFRWLFDP